MTHAKHISTADGVYPVDLTDNDEGQEIAAILDLIRPLRRHAAVPPSHQDGGKAPVGPPPEASISADQGQTSLGEFDTGGRDGGDWANSVANDAFDAAPASSVVNAVSANDISEMDALGWNVDEAPAPAAAPNATSGGFNPSGGTISATTTPSVAAAGTVPASRGDSPDDYNSVLGKALNLGVPSEAPSSDRIRVTALPTNGTIVLSNGSTSVAAGESLTPAQAAGLRFKSNGVASSSHFDFDEEIPGTPPIHKSVDIPFDPNTNTVTPATTAPIAGAPTAVTPTAPASDASISGLTVFYSPGSGAGTTSLAEGLGNGGAAAVTFGTTASAFVINISWDASVSTAPAGFQSAVMAAAQHLESQFVDPVTINISIGYGDVNGTALGSGKLAQTCTYLNSYSYSALRSALSTDATSSVNCSFVTSLPTSAPVDGTFWATSAEAKALGLASATGTGTDGYIGFSSSYPFTYDDSAGVASGTYDFMGVVLHEMTEVMGRLMLSGTTIGTTGSSYDVLDLMHYSSAGVREFSASSPGYSSLDGGQTSLGEFNTDGGDGGDWANSVANDAFDATPAAGVVNAVSTNDISEMNALGWNVDEAPAPAPAPNATSGGFNPSGGTISATTTPSVAAAGTVPASRGDSPDDYNSVLGKALNLGVPSEAPSSDRIRVTALPTNGTIVLSNGSTSVAAGESLTPAQAAGLRFKSKGVASSSHFDFDEQIPGTPLIHRSVALPFDPTTNTITPATTAPIAGAPSKATLNAATAPMAGAPTTVTSTATTTSSTSNSIVLENQKPGTAASIWQIAPGQDSTKIQGFTTGISTPVGGTVQFKVNNQTSNGSYQIQIYRLGYYGGNGATLVTTLNHSGNPIVQPNALNDPKTGLNDAGNWSVTDSWAVPSAATSGVYVANVIDGSAIFQIPFVITNPSSTSDIVFQTSDETWQAYNGWGGNSLYGGNGPSTGTPGAAFAVSYNRPIVTRDSIGTYAGPQDALFGAEFSSIYWLEQNGYDTSYISGMDAATNSSILLKHKVFMDTGHDEYWTDSQVANVQAANKAGVSLAFFSGNELFWQTRLSPSINSSADPSRTLVSYKDTHSNQLIDPSGTATGTFQDPRFGTAPNPSNAVTGTLFQVDQTNIVPAITIPYGETNLRFWRNTSVAQTAPGQTASLATNILGYEWDSSPDNGYMPAGLINLSSTTSYEPAAYNTNWGNVDTSGNATNSLVEYRNPTSGALVFGAGTVFWSWGLTNQHDNSPSPFSSSTPDPSAQQATVNFLADMGVQPQTLQASLVIASQSTDKTPPTSTITSVSSNSVVEGQSVTVMGTATDAGGGVIGGVQVSIDGGKTWHPANGQVGSTTTNWSYSFSAPAAGTYTVKSRAVDDSLNLETSGTGVSIAVTPSTALNLFDASATPTNGSDANAIEVGVKFTSTTTGLVTGVRFYKGTSNTGTHVGDLWSASGTLLASATFSNETASGWQQVNFSSPVSIAPGTTYIASYHTNTGNYADGPYFFATYQGQTNGALNAPGDSLNGVYAYGASSIFPINTSTTADNYWVDVVFNDSGRSPPVLSNIAASASYTAGGNATTLSSSASVTDPQSATLVSGSVSIASGLLAGDTLAASTSGTSVSANYNASTGILSLMGTDTLAHYQQVLDSVGYSSSNQNPTNYGADSSRTVSWIVNDGSVSSATQTTTVSLTGGPSTANLFSSTATPGTITANDPNAVDLGVKFQASTSGTIAGIRFYKGPQNTGIHIGDLWTNSRTLLASATFTNETASGWQQVNFSTPVSITAGTTYIASYEAPVGEYSEDDNYFANAVTNGPLTAPSSASSGGNGVYAYGSSNPFPNSSYNASNYWVDVAFVPSTPLTFTTSASISGTAQEGSVLTASNAVSSDPNAVVSAYQWQSSSDSGTTWSNIAGATASTYTPVEADETHLLRMVETATDSGTSQSGTSTSAATAAVTDITLAFISAASISGSATVGSVLTAGKGTLNDADAAVTGYQWQSSTNATWSPISGATSSTYTPVAADQGHQLRVAETATDTDGGPSTTSNSTATAAVSAQPSSLFSATATPGTVTANDPNAVDLGVKFQASTSGTIAGIRFYKGPQNTGTHIGDLWTNSGTLLASATFSNETASGWQQVNFSTPVSIAAGTTYIASYEAPVGEYSADANYFANAVTNGPLTAPSSASSGGNGVYAYGSSNPFPNSSYNASNYWVDVAFVPSTPLTFTTSASISGTAQEGAVLTAGNAVSSDPNAVVSAYQWQSSSDSGTTWSNIAGATASTYTPVEADETHLLRMVETATDSGTSQTGTSTSAATAAVTDITLAFISAASISGSATVGSVLTAGKGTLNDADAAVTGYQWQSSTNATWSPISGATSSTYTPVAADQGHQLRVAETATDTDGGPSTTSNSTATAAVTNNNLTFTSPTSITGTAQEGSVLTASNAVSSDPNAVVSAYQWQSSSDSGTTWSNIAGATASTYTPVEADETHLLRMVETATDSGTSQSGTSTSAATAAVTDITLAFISAASISGSATVGSVLTAGKGTLNDADAAVTGYQWQSSTNATWSPISGATSSTYTPVAADQGHQLRVAETATDTDGGPSTTSNSTATAAVSAQPSSLFSATATPGTVTANDPNAVDLGVKFQASTSGTIAGIRFYKGPQNTGTHIGDLWTNSGTLLASATFSNETASGWQQVNFSTPVSIAAGTTYIASYEAPVGEYSADANYFANAVTNGPLTAPSSASSGGNGVYAYGSSNPFPNSSYNASNYWVDVAFS